ncbi:MAG: S1 RNA-binding domain-containing protein [Candidatus Paceibacterota bacterium]
MTIIKEKGYLKDYNNYLKPIQVNDIVDGKIINKTKEGIFLDLGRYGSGIIWKKDIVESNKTFSSLKPGKVVKVKIVDIDNDQGLLEASLAEAEKENVWREIKEKKVQKEEIELPVINANRGGLILEYKGIKGFLPTSRLSKENYPDTGGDKEKIMEKLKKLIGKKIKVRIISTSEKEDRLIFEEVK